MMTSLLQTLWTEPKSFPHWGQEGVQFLNANVFISILSKNNNKIYSQASQKIPQRHPQKYLPLLLSSVQLPASSSLIWPLCMAIFPHITTQNKCHLLLLVPAPCCCVQMHKLVINASLNILTHSIDWSHRQSPIIPLISTVACPWLHEFWFL